jgi:hypothetical protein
MHSPWAADSEKQAIKLDAHRPYIFELQPFEVATLQSQVNRQGSMAAWRDPCAEQIFDFSGFWRSCHLILGGIT